MKDGGMGGLAAAAGLRKSGCRPRLRGAIQKCNLGRRRPTRFAL